jgi:hypothetical protein
MGFLIGAWASAGRKSKRDLVYFSETTAEVQLAPPALPGAPDVAPAVPMPPPIEPPSEARPGVAASASPAPGSFDQLAGVLQIGDEVSLSDVSGRTFKSAVSRLSSTTITLSGPDVSREFTVAEVATISRRQSDSGWNGALIGLACGLGPALVLYQGRTGPQRVIAGTFWGGIGALIGFGVDKGIQGKEVVIFGTRPIGSATRVTLTPVALPGHFAIAGRISY